ncbi:aspartic peptidase domain-containing protein [Mycena galopus ATCC 62051]|nr:aspartic peptidase domain-containing protein [Mycena galopus ATCC 62051]
MGLANTLVCLALCALVAAQSDPGAAVSVNGLTEVPRPTSPVSVNGLSEVTRPTGDVVSGQPVTDDPGPYFSWATENSVPTSAALSGSGKSNKGKIAGGVVGGLAVIIAAIGVLVFLRLRGKRSTTHWRNRGNGTWQDQEGNAGGPVYVGRPVDRPFDGYDHDSKVLVASPTTTGPVFIRQPRLAHTPERGHARGTSSSHIRNDSTEMQGNIRSPTHDFLFVFVISGLFVSSGCGNPLPTPPAGLSLTINRRSFRQEPPGVNSSLPVCDVQPIEHEFKSLQRKYHDVEENFYGIEPDPIFFATSAMEAEAAEVPFIPVLLHTMPLVDYLSGSLDLMYYGQVEIGTPAQKLTIDVDTGSADLWLPSGCRKCTHKQFKPSKSSTCERSNETFSISYGSGEVSGEWMYDRVAFAGLEVQRQFFGAVSYEEGDFDDLPSDGLFGMGFGAIAQCGKPTFFENLIAASSISPMFSLHCARHHDDSAVCFGCIDYSKMLGSVVWVPVLTKAYWSVSMDAIIVAVNMTGEIPLATSIRAIIDSGTTLIYLPEAVVYWVYAQIPNSKHIFQPDFDFYTYPCSTVLDIKFNFGGECFSINPVDFNLGLVAPDSRDCVGGILPLSVASGFPQDLAIIGDEFLKSWYSIFDYGAENRSASVGFAPSINNAR